MARAALEDAREKVASLFGTRPRQVVFTSGATEAINAATFGALRSGRGDAVALAGVEHSSVRDSALLHGARLVELDVDAAGRIDLGSVGRSVAGEPHLALIHCQWANHEVGTIQPVAKVVEACRETGVLVHVDAAAAAGRLPVSFDDLGADLMSISAHKMGGPRGVGALLVRRGLRLDWLIAGGAQERGRRGGMENVAAAAGFGAVAEYLGKDGTLLAEATFEAELAERLRAGALSIPGVAIYGPDREEERLPGLVCLSVQGVEAEGVLIGLDQAGVAAHSGSACSSESFEPSPVLASMGADAEHSLRFSAGWSTTDVEIDLALEALPAVIEQLRRLAS
jgi:cysteine desulfurase